MMRTNKPSRQNIGASIAEFGPALFVFFFIILFPLINLIAMATGAGTVYLTAVQCATKAGESVSFDKALLASEAAAFNIEDGGFGQFTRMDPIGGWNGSGVDIYVTETDISTNVSTKNGPNVPFVTNPVDPSRYLYSYDAVVKYNIGPFMNLSSVPWIGSVPGVGVPAVLSYTVSRNVEHPEALIAAGGGAGTITGGSSGGGGGGGGGAGSVILSGGVRGGGIPGDFVPPIPPPRDHRNGFTN